MVRKGGGKMRRWLGVVLATFAALTVSAEVGLRMAGLTDFPLYQVDASAGYIPKPSQHGAFLNKNDWAFNDQSMGAAEAFKPSPSDVVLVGDSIVYGGNPFRQSEKLGPQLQRLTHRMVWPVAAGGWSLGNEAGYLLSHPAVARDGTLVLVLNSGDLAPTEHWQSDLYHPRRHPLIATEYLFRRYVWHAEFPNDAPPELDYAARLQTRLCQIAAMHPGRIVVLLYPTHSEQEHHQDSFGPIVSLIQRAMPAATVVRLADDRRWTAARYTDVIHPRKDAVPIIADVIARALEADRR